MKVIGATSIPLGGLPADASGTDAAHGALALADLGGHGQALVVDQGQTAGLGVLGR